jgi:hypothetical protein
MTNEKTMKNANMSDYDKYYIAFKKALSFKHLILNPEKIVEMQATEKVNL